MSSAADTTAILKSLSTGDGNAPAALLPHVYDELRKLAAAYLGRERPDHSLQATALVHEAYLRLVDQSQVDWRDRAHFFGLAARVMRQVLVDHARRRGRKKRRPVGERISLERAMVVADDSGASLLAVDDALNRLGQVDARSAQVVEMRFFAGLTHEQISEVLGVSDRTVRSDWSFAKAWLHREITRTLDA